MLPEEQYQDNQQTYIKHFFLEKYLLRVALNIYAFEKDFVYIDGFSGPWRSAHEKYDDASFSIAIKELKKAKNIVAARKIYPKIRCFFVEKNKTSFEELTTYLSNVKGIEYKCTNASFETATREIADFAGSSFTFAFIDPTGMTGFGMQKLKPLFKLKSEMLINFMYTEVNRFVISDTVQHTFSDLYGGGKWREEIQEKIDSGMPREDAILQTYCERIRTIIGYKYVTTTRILFPTKDRTYFHLVYATNHTKGLVEFRKVESATVAEQNRVRDNAKLKLREEKSGMKDMFGPSQETDEAGELLLPEYELKELHLEQAKTLILEKVAEKDLTYTDCLSVLELPYLLEKDVKDIIHFLAKNGEIEIVGMQPNQRRFQKEHSIKLK